MPTNEKDYNGYLLDQLALLKRLERVAQKTGAEEVLKEIDFERQFIEQKLYQKPPMISE